MKKYDITRLLLDYTKFKYSVAYYHVVCGCRQIPKFSLWRRNIIFSAPPPIIYQLKQNTAKLMYNKTKRILASFCKMLSILLTPLVRFVRLQ